jgi:hypothetical protein
MARIDMSRHLSRQLPRVGAAVLLHLVCACVLASRPHRRSSHFRRS